MKIPRARIAIPTITGGMYSPDFMYVVENLDGGKDINLVIETKDLEKESDLRGTEKAKLECAKAFFETLCANGYQVHFKEQLGNRQIIQIIDEVKKEEQ